MENYFQSPRLQEITTFFLDLARGRTTLENHDDLISLNKTFDKFNSDETFESLKFVLDSQNQYIHSIQFGLFFFLNNYIELLQKSLNYCDSTDTEHSLITESFFNLEFIQRVAIYDINLLPKLFIFQSTHFHSNFLFASFNFRTDFFTYTQSITPEEKELLRAYFLQLFTHLHHNDIPMAGLNSTLSYASCFLATFYYLVPDTDNSEWINTLKFTDKEMITDILAELDSSYIGTQPPLLNRPLFLHTIFESPSLCVAVLQRNESEFFPFCDFDKVRNKNPESFVGI